MPYTPNTLHLAAELGCSLGCKLWVYDTLDATGVVDGTGYFTGVSAGSITSRGMEVGDLVLVRIWTTSIPTSNAEKAANVPADAGWHLVRSVSAVGAATLTAETAIVVVAGS